MYPDTPLVFANTGLEFPELQKDARENGAVFVDPVLRHREVIQKFGYPVGSKKICETVHKLRHQNLSPKYRNYLLNGDERGNFGTLPKRWRCLLDAPFEVSERCCYYMKKKPLQDYLKQTGRFPIIGILAQESDDRAKSWETHGCNVLEGHHPQSWPLALWTEENCDDYINEFGIQLPAPYQMGYRRTGCMYCMYGISYDGYPNRFQIMARTHPKQYDYCIRDFEKSGLGFGFVSDYVGIEYRPNVQQNGQYVLFD